MFRRGTRISCGRCTLDHVLARIATHPAGVALPVHAHHGPVGDGYAAVVPAVQGGLVGLKKKWVHSGVGSPSTSSIT